MTVAWPTVTCTLLFDVTAPAPVQRHQSGGHLLSAATTAMPVQTP